MFATGISIYIFISLSFEENDLSQEFGKTYVDYESCLKSDLIYYIKIEVVRIPTILKLLLAQLLVILANYCL